MGRIFLSLVLFYLHIIDNIISIFQIGKVEASRHQGTCWEPQVTWALLSSLSVEAPARSQSFTRLPTSQGNAACPMLVPPVMEMSLGAGLARTSQLTLNKAGLDGHTHGRDDWALTPGATQTDPLIDTAGIMGGSYSLLLWNTNKARHTYHGDRHAPPGGS